MNYFLVTYDGGNAQKKTCNHSWVLKFGIKFLEIELNIVATLALGSQPRQEVARLRAKREAWESCSQECKIVWGNIPLDSQRNSHIGNWSSSGLPNLQRVIAGVKIQWIEESFISMEISWNLDVRNGLASPIWTSETQVMAKRRAGSRIGNLTPDH